MRYRPGLDLLEDRLPPGDALGWFLVLPAWGLTAAASELGTLQSRGLAFGDKQTGRQEDTETRRHGDTEIGQAWPDNVPEDDDTWAPASSGLGTLPTMLLRTNDGAPAFEPSSLALYPNEPNPGWCQTAMPQPARAVALPELGHASPSEQAGVMTIPPGLRRLSPGHAPAASSSFDPLPLRFEANQGQIDAQVRFLARGAGVDVFLRATDAVIVL